MNLSDAEIMMIEQLTDIKKANGNAINDGDTGKTIREILSTYTEEKLVEMENANSYDADQAALIRYMKDNDKIGDLVLDSTMKDRYNKTLALCFTEENNSEEAIVAFNGTTSKEWDDNVEGLNSSDTTRQLQAKEYIDSLSYENVTVVGHSKGGNKAMYVSILCDKVSKCISMDGQGFSVEFIDKYAPKIAERANLIKNYSVNTDYVHVLLFQIPGSAQIYCEGFRIGDDPARHHKPFSFFQIDDGNIVCENEIPAVVTEKNGVAISEDPSVVMLHQFTAYVLNVASPEEKERIVNLIATSADMLKGEECDIMEVADFLLKDPDGLSLVLAYLVKYMDTYGYSAKDVDGLLQMLGLNTLNEYFSVDIFGRKYGISDIVDLMKKNLTDGKKDRIIDTLLAAITKCLKWKKINFDLKKFWVSTENKINSIPPVSKADGIKEPQIGQQLTNVDPLIRVDTAKLRSYASRLEIANKRLQNLDKRMDRLYLKVGLRDLFNLLQADLLTGSSWRIANCEKYLDETASDFDATERNVAGLF